MHNFLLFFVEMASKLVTLLAVSLAVLYPSQVVSLWPIPRSLQSGTSALKLSSGFHISLAGDLAGHAPADLVQAIARTQGYLKNDKLERLVVGGASADASAIANAKQLSGLSVQLTGKTVNNIATESTLALGSRNEEYTLTVPADGSTAVLKANSTLGLFRGLTTFEQLWYTSGSSIYTVQAPIQIADKPAYV